MWNPPKIWRDGTVWILGGGTSLRYQAGLSDDMDEIKLIQGVNDYLQPKLRDRHVIGTNKAILLGEWVDIIYFGDNRFIREDWYLHHLRGRKGMVVTCSHIKPNEYPWIYCLERAGKQMVPIESRNGKIGWFGNTGASAINLAYLLGAKRIVLIGYDGKPSKRWIDNNWHKGYPAGQPTSEQSSQRIYGDFSKSFETIAKFLSKESVEVINVTPNTAIPYFKRGELEDELAR